MSQQNSDQNYQTFINQIVSQKEIWILTDSYGAVMLNTEDEDCVPVWASEADASQWASGEWQNCQAEAIPLKVWQHRWTAGMEEDEFYVVVDPQEDQEGLVIHPEDFDADLRKALKKLNQK